MTNKWERQDEELLLKKAKEENYEWSKIVKNVPEFSGKTDNALRRKFRSIMCKHPVEEIRNIVGKAALPLDRRPRLPRASPGRRRPESVP